MKLTAETLNVVDKLIHVEATREDLKDQFETAYRFYRSRVNLPGFRKGQIPVDVIRQRFGRDIELEEIQKELNKVYQDQIVREHNPMGETQLTKLQWENDELSATFKIGISPNVKLVDLTKLKVPKLVHDVSEKEVEEEVQRALERDGTTEEVDEKITKDHVVIVDAQSLDEKKKPIEGQLDKDQKIDLSQSGAEEFLKSLKGKRAGQSVDMTVKSGKQKDRFRVTVNKVLKKHPAEATEEFCKKQSGDQATTLDELKAHIRSQMQMYFDQTSDRLFQQDVIEVLLKAHEFQTPEVFQDQIVEHALKEYKEKQGDKLPETFDEPAYRDSQKEMAEREARWVFINKALQEKYDDIEITAEDVDQELEKMATSYGLTVEQIKGFYAQNTSELENLRNKIRDEKVFAKLESELQIKEMDKDAFNKYKEKENK